jgi:hypothetical protein
MLYESLDQPMRENNAPSKQGMQLALSEVFEAMQLLRGDALGAELFDELVVVDFHLEAIYHRSFDFTRIDHLRLIHVDCWGQNG